MLKNVTVPNEDFDLEEHYPMLMEACVPVKAIPTITYRVDPDGLQKWVKKQYPRKKQQEAFWVCLGVNTMDSLGLYLHDVEYALERLSGKPTPWD